MDSILSTKQEVEQLSVDEIKKKSSISNIKDSKYINMKSNQIESLKLLEQLDLLPMILSLMDDINSGKVSAKDVHNTAGPIRSKLSAAKRALQQCENLDQSIDERKKLGELYLEKIERKRQLLQQFQHVMNVNPTSSPKTDLSTMDIDTDIINTIDNNNTELSNSSSI